MTTKSLPLGQDHAPATVDEALEALTMAMDQYGDYAQLSETARLGRLSDGIAVPASYQPLGFVLRGAIN